MIKEVFVPIEHNPVYEVSNLGNVKNSKTNKILSKRYDQKGYSRISIPVKGKYKDFKIHRLVASYFCENQNPNEYTIVNHIDGDKSNNVYTNLEWTNSSRNSQHAFDTGLHSHVGELNTNLKLTDKQVLEIWSSNLTARQIEKIYNISYGYARRLIKRDTRKYLL